MSAPIDIAALRWAKLDPRNGNYSDCQAWVDLCSAAELVGTDVTTSDVLGFCWIDGARTAYRVAIDEGEAVWIVTMDHDGAPDGHSVARRVEIIRC